MIQLIATRRSYLTTGLACCLIVTLLVASKQIDCHDGHDHDAAAGADAAAIAAGATGEHDHHDHHGHHDHHEHHAHNHEQHDAESVHLEEHKNNEKLKGHQQPYQHQHKPLNYRLEWVVQPDIVHGFGERKLITQCITTGEKPGETPVSTNFLHTFEVESSGFERNLDDFVQKSLADVANKFNLTRKKAQRSLLRQKFLFDKRSKAVVMFRDQVIKLEGRVRKVYNDSCSPQQQQVGQVTKQQVSCLKAQKNKKSSEFDLSIRATEVDENGKAKGSFSIEYFGLDKFRHPQFYNLADRFVELDDMPPEGSEDIRSPHHCAELALNASKLIAVYDVVHMSCTFGEPSSPSRINGKLPSIFSLDKTGKLIGNYTFMAEEGESSDDSAMQILERTDEKPAVDKWAAEKKCDLINSVNGLYSCLKFEERPASVLMFRRAQEANNNNNKAAGPSQ